MSKMPTTRLLELARILRNSPDGETLKNLCKQLGTSSRTVLRYLAELKEIEPELKYTYQKSEISSGHTKTKLWTLPRNRNLNPNVIERFSADEAAVVSLGCAFFNEFLSTSYFGKTAKSALDKIKKHLEAEEIQQLNRLLKKVKVRQYGWCDYNYQRKVLPAIIQGLQEQTEVEIVYQTPKANKPEKYYILPYLLQIHEGTLYLTGYSYKSKNIRVWKVDRIKAAFNSDVTFSIPRDFDADDYIAGTFGIYSGEPRKRVRIRIDKADAKYVQEHYWHSSQHFDKQSDGSVIVSFNVPVVKSLLHWVLRFGSTAEVLAPAELQEMVKKEIKAMRKKNQ
jgi:predicted DNA-binding transcriptional regulator YafY